MGYILGPQLALIGKPDVIGFEKDGIGVREIPRDLANELIMKNHYSKKYYAATYIHLGYMVGSKLMGVLQLGYAMNPASAGSVVTGTALDEYLELNRMWLSEEAPKQSASRALSAAIKYVRRKYPKIKWIQSFADERCGKFGLVYQAAGFDYFGEHMGRFWELDGEFFHDSILTDSRKAMTPKGSKLRAAKGRAKRHDLRQFRYIYFMKPRFKRGVNLKQKPYPKHYADGPLDEPGATRCEGGGTPPVRSKTLHQRRQS